MATLGLPPPASAVPFADGGFEPPGVPAAPVGGFTLYTGGQFLGSSAWLVGGSGGDVVNTDNIAAHSGVQSYDLSGSATAPGTISSTFDTIPGAEYFAEFWLAGNPLDTGGVEFPVKSGQVAMAPGAALPLTFDTAGRTATDVGWVPMRYPATAGTGVVAEGSSLTIEFLSTGDPNGAGLMIDDVSISIVPSDVSVTKTGPATVTPSTTVTYDILVANDGPGPATDVMATDTLPDGYEFVSASDGGSLSGDVVTWSLDTMQPGTSIDLTLTVASPANPTAGPTNSVSVTSTTPDPDEANNLDGHTSTVSVPTPRTPPTSTTTTSTTTATAATAATTATSTTVAATPLPRTGVDMIPALLAGSASVVTGSVLVAGARRRRRRR